ncbi:hypothetical protein QYE76_058451 [Lolium multiflorum]|uniref:Uncharacterized protein n=1 Tax=Lolium multiflorum TaxID=4521 RepID=A0AAD8T5N4_LOLMU|nr:hypothetical protein QYE76_058451 [Lolium multiflorum]
MAMEPLPLGFGDFSITMDASLASLWPLAQDDAPHCYRHMERSVEELQQKLAAATAELQVVTEGVRLKDQNIAALMELIRRTAQERDLLQEQHQLLLAHELAGAATSSSSESDPAPGDDPSTLLFKLPSPPEATAVIDRPSAFLEPSSVEITSAAAAAAAQLELLSAQRPLPHKGRLLQAVMEAGPLLHNLLVAGPLLRWRNPPPVLVSLTNAMISAPSGSGVELLTAPTGS